MHTVRSGIRVCDSGRLRQQSPMNSDQATRVSAPPSRSSSTSFEQSPAIAEVLRQIASAKTSVAELRTQLTECQTSASQSRSILQQEVDAHRERKRQEDASKADLKTRTKNLEDSKRTAEGLKKEADKKLKSAQTTRDDAAHRMDFLDTAIKQLQDQLAQDRDFITSGKDQTAEEERVIPDSIEQKRHEIKVAEDQIQALNQRSREFEEKLASRRERLRILRQKIEQYTEKRSNRNFDQQHLYRLQDPWLGVDDGKSLMLSPLSPIQHDEVWNTQLDSFGAQHRVISSVPLEEQVTAFNGKGFASFPDSHLVNGHATDVHVHQKLRTLQVHFPQEFVPIGSALEEDNMSRSFKSDNDPYLDRNWSVAYANGKSNGSLLTTSSRSTDDVQLNHGSGVRSVMTQRASSTDKPRLRSSTLSSKGLNPDAKEFNFSPLSSTFCSSSAAHSNSMARKLSPNMYDVLNPSGYPSTTPTTQQSLLRAFALSPAEREALQRTLGGLGSRSFEGLPNLSDVGSIPSSPTSSLPTPSGDFRSRLPVWLQSLPRNRKVNFSPWDDEEPQSVNNSTKS